jgi:hypothetical protein
MKFGASFAHLFTSAKQMAMSLPGLRFCSGLITPQMRGAGKLGDAFGRMTRHPENGPVPRAEVPPPYGMPTIHSDKQMMGGGRPLKEATNAGLAVKRGVKICAIGAQA